MDYLLDLTNLDTKRFFITGELQGDYDALMRLLYQQRFGWADTFISTGNFFNVNNPKSLDMAIFLRNSLNCYSVKGESEVKLLQDIEKEDVMSLYSKKFGTNFNEHIISYIKEMPLVIKIGDYFVMNAGLDPTKTLVDQDPEVFYTIGEYDKDSRFYQYPNPEESSWYNIPYLIDGKRSKICFSKIYLNNIEIPAGYNLGRNLEVAPIFRTLIIDKTQGLPSIITSF